MTEAKYLIDTNFILRYLLAETAYPHYQETVTFFEKVQAGEQVAILCESVLAEVVYVLASYYKVPRDTIADVLSDFILYKGILFQDKQSLIEALFIFKDSSRLHFVDSLILARSKHANLKIKTFDKALLKYTLKDN